MGRFRVPDDIANDYTECAWRSCNRKPALEMPLCFRHLCRVYSDMREILLAEALVKIGTTTDLKRRVTDLRSNRYYQERGMNYIAALEPGGRSLERKRHKQFEADRVGCTEDFRLSDQLTNHIGSLLPSRDAWYNQAVRDGSLQVVYYLTDGPLTTTDLTR